MGKISWTYCMSKKSCPFFVKKLAIFKLTIFLGHTVCPRSLVHFFVKQLAISKWTRFFGHTVYASVCKQLDKLVSKHVNKDRVADPAGVFPDPILKKKPDPVPILEKQTWIRLYKNIL